MKYMYAALIALGLLSTGLVQAKVEEETIRKHHVIKKKSPYKKVSKPASKPAKTQSYRRKTQPKKSVYKNVTKRASTATAAAAAPVAVPAALATATAAAKPATTEETAYQKFTNWLTGATPTTTAAKQALIGHHRAAGYHIGPRDWHHNFPEWWVKSGRGWTAADVDGVWYFGGHPIEWWASKPEYASYYKNVIHPEFLKAHPEKR